MSDWPAPSGSGRFTTFGAGAQGSVRWTSAASANTKGAWSEMLAATAFDVCGITITFEYGYDAANVAVSLLDIGIGAGGSEVVVVPNIIYSGAAAAAPRNPCQVYFPVYIPAGSRIATRGQSSVASYAITAGAVLHSSTFLTDPAFGLITDYGADSANSRGTAVDTSGVSNVKGGWVELTAATSRPHKGIVLGFGHDGSTAFANTYNEWNVDVGVGGSGSEQIIVPNYQLTAAAVSSSYQGHIQHSSVLMADIPAGSRLAMRASAEVVAGSTNRALYPIIYGLS